MSTESLCGHSVRDQCRQNERSRDEVFELDSVKGFLHSDFEMLIMVWTTSAVIVTGIENTRQVPGVVICVK